MCIKNLIAVECVLKGYSFWILGQLGWTSCLKYIMQLFVVDFFSIVVVCFLN